MNDIFVSALHSIPCVFFRMFEMRWKWIILEVQIFNLNQARKNLFHGLNGLVHILAQMHIGELQTEMISKVSRYFKTYYQDISKNAIKVQFHKWKLASFEAHFWHIILFLFAFPKSCILVPPKCTRIFWDVIVPICMNVKYQHVKFLVIFWLFFEGIHPNMYFIRQKLSLSSREKMAICYFLLSRYECRWFLPSCA